MDADFRSFWKFYLRTGTATAMGQSIVLPCGGGAFYFVSSTIQFISFLRPYNNFSVLKYTFYLEKLCFKVGLRRSVNNLLDGNEVDV